MLQTPTSFIPLHSSKEHLEPDLFLDLFVFRAGELLVRDADYALPSAEERAQLNINDARLLAVGLIGDRYCCTAWVEENVPAPAGFSFRNMRALFGVVGEQVISIAGRAAQIAEWARTHQYCGVCAAAMDRVESERCFQCPTCGMAAYPRISPAMMVLIRKGDAILLARNSASPGNRFSALAGFLEAGESVEDAVHREVFEEVGLTVNNLKYFGSQSWPFPHSLMIAFTADYVAGEIVIDQREIAEARWFGPGDALPEFAVGISISGALITAHLPGKS